MEAFLIKKVTLKNFEKEIGSKLATFKFVTVLVDLVNSIHIRP